MLRNLSPTIEQYEVNAATANSQIKNSEYKTSSQSLQAGADRRRAGSAGDNAGRAAITERALAGAMLDGSNRASVALPAFVQRVKSWAEIESAEKER